MSAVAPPPSALAAGLKALGLEASARQQDQLWGHALLMGKWNRVYNLTALRSPQDMLTHHLLDSLAVVPALDRHLATGRGAASAPLRVMDVGSGGGLPGVTLAVMRPQLQVVCVDAVVKKTTFIQQVAAELGLDHLKAVHGRVEALSLPPFDLITSRAFASLADMVALTRGHLAPGGVWMAMKGQHPHEEIAALPPDIEVFHVEPLTVPGLDAQRCVVWMRTTT